MNYGQASTHDPVAGVANNEIREAFKPTTLEINLETVARLCHEINRIWCQMTGDPSQVSWDQAEDYQKASSMEGVKYTLSNTAITPRDQHMAWLSTKQEEGWKWGAVKDPSVKEHPCFCSYENLPWQHQVKDHLFFYVVKSLEPLMSMRAQSPGERIMGKTFNPSHDWRIDWMKGLYANLFDFITRFAKDQNAQPNVDDDFARREIGRSAAESKTLLQTSKMHCVEAMTR